MKTRHLTLALLLLCTELATAAITSGKVYRITNAAFNRVVAEDYQQYKIVTTPTVGDNTTWEQLWVVTAGETSGNYTLQNVYTGRYMNRTIYQSKQMTTVTTTSELTLATSSYDNTAFTIQGSMYAHCANTQSYWLVGWNTPASNANAFYFQEVEDVDIEAARASFEALSTTVKNTETYDATLQTFFTDRACTTLKSEYQAYSDEDLRTAVATLPTTLQDMAVKVKNNSWDTHELRYRVHDYKPYSDARSWATKNNTYAHTNMNNPTGIVVNNKSLLYVMVDSETPADATLYMAGVRGESTQNGTTSGTQLHQGLNILVCSGDGTAMYLYYVVKTIDNKVLYKPLSDYPDIKIHIEGGDVYGYYEVGVDSEDDFDWLKTNATDSRFSEVCMIQVKGGFTTWYMHKDNLFAGTNKSEVKKSMLGWDLVVSNEHALSGILRSHADDIYAKIYKGNYLKSVTQEWIDGTDADDYYGNYYNNLAMAWSTTDGYYMYGTEYLTHYQAGVTMRGCVSWSGLLGGGTWGLSHEIGHQHQGPICMPATMECSNNLFSNVNYWMHGVRVTEGCKMDEYEARDYDKKTPFLRQDIWSQMRMYYQLFLYYHAAEHNKKFYPNLFKALRDDPMVGHKNQSDITTGKETFFHFVEKCCDIAGEDLTEFFRAWGFFVPWTGDVDDYGIFHIQITQEEIDECISTIKAKGYPENTGIIFIEDRIDKNAPVTGMAAAGAYTDEGVPTSQTKSHTNDFGSYGQYTEFIDGNQQTPTGYTLSQEGKTLTFSGGTGAVGFLIYDASGTLLGYTNTGTYTLLNTYDGGDITIKAIGANSKLQDIPGFSKIEAVSSALNATLQQAQVLIDLEDTAGTHPGWYVSSALATLKSLMTDANTAVESGDAETIAAANEALLEEIAAIKAATGIKTPIKTGTYYRMRNYNYSGWYAYLTGENVKCINTNTLNTDKWWRFYAATDEGTYRISSYDGHFISYVSTSVQVKAATTEEASGVVFEAVDNGDGTWFFRGGSQSGNGLHCDSGKKLVGWGNTDPSKWYLEEAQPGYDITYDYYFNDVLRYSETSTVAKNEPYPTPSYTGPYGIVTPEAPEGTVTEAETVRLDLSLTPGYPFTFSEEVATTTWYSIKMRAGYVHYNSSESNFPEVNTKLQVFAVDDYNDYFFAFLGDPYGFKVLNKAGVYLKSTGGNNEAVSAVTTTEEATTFLMRATTGTETYGPVYFCLDGITGTVNDVNGKLGFWADSRATSDVGSQMTIEPLTYPFQYGTSYADIPVWYYFRGHSNQTHYMYNNSGSIAFSDTKPDNDTRYLWGFVGNPTDGFQIYAFGTPDKAVDGKNPSTLSADGTTFQWVVKPGSAGSQGSSADAYFAMWDSGNSNWLNYQSGALKRWSANDAGSCMMINLAAQSFPISAAGWGTGYTEGNMKLVEGDVTAYYAAVDGDAIVKTEASVVPAGTGILLKSNQGTATRAIFMKTPDAVDTEGVSTNLLRGTTKMQGKNFSEAGYTYYKLANGTDGNGANGIGFYWEEDNGASVVCPHYKSILAVPAGNNVKGFLLEDEETTVDGLRSTAGGQRSTAIYNLAGQRVGANYHGIVIVNGQKILR